MIEKINEAFGEVSALFMSQGDTPAGKIIMPVEDLVRIANQLEIYIRKELKLPPKEDYSKLSKEEQRRQEEIKKNRKELEEKEKAHIKKYGKCEKDKTGLHRFNYVVDNRVRACMSCGQKMNMKTDELIGEPGPISLVDNNKK